MPLNLNSVGCRMGKIMEYQAHTHRLRNVDYFLIAFLFLLSFWFQSHVYFNWDASWHLEAAKRIVHGGASYSKNLYDDNLPMVFWYFIPTVLIHKITGIFIITLALISIHLSILLCFLLSDRSLKIIYQHAPRWKLYFMRYALLLFLFFMPGQEFGQRDMMVLLFMLPYIVLTATRDISNQEKNLFIAILIGFLAGIGIAMNPYYSLLILALEIQSWIYFKCVSLKKPELIAVVATFFLYLISIAFLYPDYYTHIIPSYFALSSAYNQPIKNLFQNFSFESLCFAGLVYGLFFFKKERNYWIQTLWVCSIAAFIVFMLNKKLFLSHLIVFDVCVSLFFVAAICDAFVYNIRWSVIVLSVYALLYGSLLSAQANVEYYLASTSPHSNYVKLASYFHQFQGKHSILILDTQSFPMVQLSFYTNLDNVSPWSSCWTIRALMQSEKKLTTLASWKQVWIKRYKALFIKQVADVLENQRPDFIFISMKKNQGGSQHFSYIDLLKQNSIFMRYWKDYYLKQVIGSFQIYARSNGKLITS
jgi:hypothetical protein